MVSGIWHFREDGHCLLLKEEDAKKRTCESNDAVDNTLDKS